MARKKPVSAEVQEATAKLRTYHQLGMGLLKDHEPDATRWADLKAVCEQSGLPAHQVRTLRKFAALYTKNDLKQLCRQCEQHNRVIGLTAVRHLIKFRDRRKRAQFQSRLIAGAWSNSEIVAQLKRVLRPAWKGGRKPRVAEDVPGVLLQLQGFAVAWRRWSERLADADDDEIKVRRADLPRGVQAAMKSVTTAFEALSAAVSQQHKGADSDDQAERGQRSNVRTRSRDT